MQKPTLFDTHMLTWTDVTNLLRKRGLLMAFTFLAVLVGAWGVLQAGFTDLYETQASLLVKVGRENIEVPVTVQKGQVLSQGVRIADINSEVQMLSAPGIVEAVVDRFGVEPFRNPLVVPTEWQGYPKYYLKRSARAAKSFYKEFLVATNLKKRLSEREEVILAVVDGLKVEPVKESDVLVMKLRLPSAKLSVDVANEILKEYMVRRAAVRQTPAGADFFATQVRENERRLSELLADRAKVRDQWNLSSTAEQRSLLLKQAAEIDTAITMAQSDIAKLEREGIALAESIQRTPAIQDKEYVESRNPSIQSIKDRITALQVEKAKILGRYTQDSEVVKKVESEMADLEAILAREPATVRSSQSTEANPVIREFSKETQEHRIAIAGLEGRNLNLREPSERIQKALKDISLGSDAMEVLDRNYRLAEQDYFTYHTKLEEARISEDLDARRVANVALIAQPNTPIEPVYPRKLFIMLLCIPTALLIAVSFGAFLECLDDRIRSSHDLAGVEELAYLGTFRFELEPVKDGAGKWRTGGWRKAKEKQKVLVFNSPGDSE
jgi:polysaccharide biosynthesis protein PslE